MESIVATNLALEMKVAIADYLAHVRLQLLASHHHIVDGIITMIYHYLISIPDPTVITRAPATPPATTTTLS